MKFSDRLALDVELLGSPAAGSAATEARGSEAVGGRMERLVVLLVGRLPLDFILRPSSAKFVLNWT